MTTNHELPEHIEALLIDAADGALSQQGQATLDDYARAHPSVRLLIAPLRDAGTALAASAQANAPAPRHFSHNVMAAVAKLPRNQPVAQPQHARSWAALMLTCIIAFFGLLVISIAPALPPMAGLVRLGAGVGDLIQLAATFGVNLLRQTEAQLLMMAIASLMATWTVVYRQLMRRVAA
jgi:hypothetical protein